RLPNPSGPHTTAPGTEAAVWPQNSSLGKRRLIRNSRFPFQHHAQRLNLCTRAAILGRSTKAGQHFRSALFGNHESLQVGPRIKNASGNMDEKNPLERKTPSVGKIFLTPVSRNTNFPLSEKCHLRKTSPAPSPSDVGADFSPSTASTPHFSA